MGDAEPTLDQLTKAQSAVVEHEEGALLVLGVAGSGRTEALARRIAVLTAGGSRALGLTSSQAACARLRGRAEAAIEGSFEELSVHCWNEAAERLLREYAGEAGIDPFFTRLGAADRLAMLLDRLDELPLRRHEIRGNPAGLLARLIERIDALKAEGIDSTSFGEWAARREAEAETDADLDAAQREREFADVFARHDAMVHESGALDAGDLVLELTRVLQNGPGLRERIADRFPHLVVDELEDTSRAERGLLTELATGATSLACACDDDQAQPGVSGAGAAWLREAHKPAEVTLEGPRRSGGGLIDAAHAVIAPLPDRAELSWEPQAEGPEGTVSFWRCANERAEAQGAAIEVEKLLNAGEIKPEGVCIAVPEVARAGRAVAAALEERSIPYRLSGPAAFFLRPEVRDAIAWLRLLTDPSDASAAVRALTRPPIGLRSVDLARVTTIARRRKLDMISALEAALESPQIPPEARDRIEAFLKLYRAASKAIGELRADVFVRRLIERIGFRRQRLFAAQPEAAERLVNLSRLAEIAAAWMRREPQGSNRDFVRYLAAISAANVPPEDEPERPAPGAVRVLEIGALKGLEFERVYLLGLHRGALPGAPPHGSQLIPPALVEHGDLEAEHTADCRRLLYTAMTRASGALTLSWPQTSGSGELSPSPLYEDARRVIGADEVIHEEELFGPAEGLHATYRMIREEVLEAAWHAGGTLSELRLDTYMDVQRAQTRYLEMLKLAALLQRPGEEPTAEAIAAINELLGQAVSPELREALGESGLDEYLLDAERSERRREEVVAAREEPSLEAFLPRRGEGLALSATDIDLYRTCPLKYKFARVFSIPQEQTINQRFGIVIHQVLERFHGQDPDADSDETPLDRLMSLFVTAWRRSGFGETRDELQFRERAVTALRRYAARDSARDSEPVWIERGFDFRVGPHHLRGRVDRVDRLPDGGYELIDYKTGDPKTHSQLASDLQLAVYRLAAREAWDIEAEAGAYWYILADEKVAVAAAPDDLERVERTALSVGEGILSQDFEPRPSPSVCSWCDFRLICPASEA